MHLLVFSKWVFAIIGFAFIGVLVYCGNLTSWHETASKIHKSMVHFRLRICFEITYFCILESVQNLFYLKKFAILNYVQWIVISWFLRNFNFETLNLSENLVRQIKYGYRVKNRSYLRFRSAKSGFLDVINEKCYFLTQEKTTVTKFSTK